MAIIAPAGVVGRVVVPSARSAQVQLLIDRNAAAGALIERSRAQGVVVGGGDDRLRLGIRVGGRRRGRRRHRGDVGHRRDLSQGLRHRHASSRWRRAAPPYKRITVKPAVDFSSLEEVLVVLTPTPARGRRRGLE